MLFSVLVRMGEGGREGEVGEWVGEEGREGGG